MSVCMSTSVKSLPKARFLASRRTLTPLWARNANSKARWNSSRAGNSGGKVEAGVGKRVSKGWTTSSVLGLMAATAFGANGFAKYQAQGRELRMRDYSSPEKWVEPKYASRKDMEDVSSPEPSFRPGKVLLQAVGLSGDWEHLYRQHSCRPVGSGVVAGPSEIPLHSAPIATKFQ